MTDTGGPEGEAEAKKDPPVASAVRRELKWIVLAALVFLGVGGFKLRGQLHESEASGAWLRAHFAELRRDPAALSRATGSSASEEWAAAYRAVAASQSESLPRLFSFDSQSNVDVLVCVNLELHGPTSTKLGVILSRRDTEQGRTHEVRAISAARECFCDPDLVARCALR